jgi:hypothetical protein
MLWLGTVPEAEGARPDLEAIAQTLILARIARRLDGAIVQALEFGLKLIRTQTPPGVELERTSPDARGQGPALPLELAAYHTIEMDAIEDHGQGRPEHQDQRPAGEYMPKPQATAFG